jgi:hypothetical protein
LASVRGYLVVFALLGLSASCLRYTRSAGTYGERGTCDSAWSYYVGCRGGGDAALARGCLDECEAIFVTDGVTDAESLREFEALECNDAIAFVEGDSGRPPGGGGPPAGDAVGTAGRAP